MTGHAMTAGGRIPAWAAKALLIVMMLVFLGAMRPAMAARTIQLDGHLSRMSMFGMLEVVEDPTGALTLDQVKALPDSRFSDVTHQNFMVGFSASAFWLRARLVNRDIVPVEWVVKQHLPVTDFVKYWVVVDGKVVTSAVGGDMTRLSERQVPYRYPAVKHTSQPGEAAELYVQIRNLHEAYILLLYEMSSGRHFVEKASSEQMMLGVLYGMPLALAFMAMIAWIVTRDGRFSIYALYALSVLGSWLGLNGMLGEYLFVDYPAMANNAMHVFFLLAIIFSAMFSRGFLRTRTLLPWCDRFFQALIWTSVACIILRVAGVYTFVTKAANILLIVDAATPIIGWLALRRGVSYARWYLIAQLFYSTMMVAGVALAQATYYSFGGFIYAEVAFFGQLLLLSVAQYDRMRSLQKDKERAEQHYQEELKIQVAERTRDLEDARNKADQASRSKSEFLANMSHEIRTPINAVAGFTTLALRTSLTSKQADYLEKIRTATQGLSRIIDDLLDFSKIEAGHLDMEHTPFRLDHVIDTTSSYVKPQIDAKGLKWTLDMAPDVPLQWMGDPLRLGQVLTNLCSNAVKFTEHGEVALRVKLVSKMNGRARLQFEVSDTGIGLTPDQAGKLFQAFTQADTSTTRKFGGTGLGLVISQRLVSMMNGRIWLESKPGAGTTFFFDVELEVAEGCGQTQAAAQEVATPAGRLAGVKLLLVEDNPVNQQLANELLAQEGAEVRIAANGRIALQLLQEVGMDHFDLALVDLEMPEMDGFETVRRIRQLESGESLPIVAMTAHAMKEERDRCIAAGMQDHIAKPFDAEAMVEKLAVLAARKRRDTASPVPLPSDAVLPVESVTEDVPADLHVLLERFDEAMRRINGGLAPLQKPAQAEPVSAGRGDALNEEMQSLLRQLRTCLQENDTRAEDIITGMQKLAGEQQPAWLAQVAQSVDALEYDVALAHLKALAGEPEQS